MRRNLWSALGLAAIGALLLASYAAGRYVDQRQARNELLVARELIYLPSPATARAMSFGFEQLVADWYWVRGLQYFVEPAQELNHYRNLGDFLDVVGGRRSGLPLRLQVRRRLHPLRHRPLPVRQHRPGDRLPGARGREVAGRLADAAVPRTSTCSTSGRTRPAPPSSSRRPRPSPEPLRTSRGSRPSC